MFTFGQLLDDAAAICEQDGVRLVLVVDGLDEDNGVMAGADAHSIPALLPARPPRGVQVIVASRPDPPVPSDVPSWHPLRDQAIVRQLTAAPEARVVRDDAERELARLLSDDKLGRELLGFMVASGGGLTGADLTELMGRPPWEVEQVLKSVSGRSFTGRKSFWQGSGAPVFVLAHEELQRTAIQSLGSRAVDDLRNRLHVWADRHRSERWPPGTPEYLLREYPRMLRSVGDLPRMHSLATDLGRLDRMLDVSGGDAAALTEVVSVLEFASRQSHLDLSIVLHLAVTRDRLTSRNRAIPHGLLTAWVNLGKPHRTEELARSVTSAEEKAENLTTLAKALLQAGNVEEARRVAYQAENAARLIDNGSSRMIAWAALTEVLAKAGDHETADRALQAKAAADLLTKEYRQALAAEAERERHRTANATTTILDSTHHTYHSTMAALARAQVAAGDLAGARSTIHQIDLEPLFASSMNHVKIISLVEAMTMAGDLAWAQKTASAIPDGYEKVQALTIVAPAMGGTKKTRDRSQQLLYEAETAVTAIAYPSEQAAALILVAEAFTATGDLHRARDLIKRADAKAFESIEQDSEWRHHWFDFLKRFTLFTDLVRAMVKLGDAERARQLVQWMRTAIAQDASAYAPSEDARDAPTYAPPAYDPSKDARAMERVVAALIEIGDLDKARQIAHQIEALARGEIILPEEIRVKQNLAVALVRVGNLNLARDIVTAIDSTARDYTLILVGEVLSEMGELRQAEDIVSSVGNPELRTRKLLEFTGKRIERKEFGQAGYLSDQALSAVSSISSEPSHEILLGRVAETLAQIGDDSRANQIFQNISDSSARDSFRLKLAEIRAKNGAVDEAESILEHLSFGPGMLMRTKLPAVIDAMVRAGAPNMAIRWAGIGKTWSSESVAALIKALAETGDLYRAATIARSITRRSEKVTAMTMLMEVSFSAKKTGHYPYFAELAESSARATTDQAKKARSLLSYAEALIRTANQQAAMMIMSEAESIARSLHNQRTKASIQCALVKTLLEVSAYDRAGEIALYINDPVYQLEAATLIIEKSDLQCAQRLLASILVAADPILYLDLVAKVEPRAILEAARYLGVPLKAWTIRFG